MEGFLNCVFTLLALPLGIWCLGYGLYLLIVGSTDYGVFLALLGALLLGAVASGYLRGRGRRRLRAATRQDRKKR